MRTILLLTALVFHLTLHAQVPVDSMKLAISEINPDSSAIGKPIGDTVKKMIGPEGGNISSADGMMELTFPPGALATPTEIGIQPVESTSIMSFGNSYACTPDGIHFQKPVQLVMRYTDSIAKGTQRAIRIIQWQDRTGRWTPIEDVKTDSTARSITCGIGHFTTYAPATKFAIKPDWARIKVKQQRFFILTITGTYPDGKKYRPGVDANNSFWPGHTVEWSVNGVVNGDDNVGHITAFDVDAMNRAIYTAPATIPSDPVGITAKYIGTVQVSKDSSEKNPISVAVVDIYDEFHYRFTGYDQVGHMYMIDSASCDIQAYSSGMIRLTNIRNPTPWSDWPASVGKCSYVYPDKTGWKGMVQITGMSSGEFQRIPGGTSYHPAPTTKILILLKPALGSSPVYKENCSGFVRMVPSMPVPAQPVAINLELLPSTSDILITYGSETGVNTLERMRGKQGFYIDVTHK